MVHMMGLPLTHTGGSYLYGRCAATAKGRSPEVSVTRLRVELRGGGKTEEKN